ncbi:MAG: tetratricopeptide repeat protein [Thermodesulfobacteriota bacterium]|nr:tetratricopeptide repeat protein [Thermodesulfobacteriota bacterium]
MKNGISYPYKLKQLNLHTLFRLMLLTCLSVFSTVSAFAEDPPSTEGADQQVTERLYKRLWRQAETALEKEDLLKAAGLLERIHRRYPDSKKADEALWMAAGLQKQIASESEDPNWEKTKNLFRMYVTDYPESPKAPEAYFEVANAYYKMRFFREALAYYGLFKKRYPDSPLVPTTSFWQAKTLFQIGRLKESKEIFLKLIETKNPDLQIKAALGLGEIEFKNENYRQALKTYENILEKFPAYHLKDLEILKLMGITNLRMKKEKQGRKQLYQYLNLAERSPYKAEILFEVADSYRREGDHLTSQVLFNKVIDEGDGEKGFVILSRFRQAQFLDDPNRKLRAWQRKPDLTDPAGDSFYLAVLDARFPEKFEQDARFGILIRYMARKDYDSVYDLGNLYVRYECPESKKKEIFDMLGQVLIHRAEKYLEKQKFQEVYELYRDEYRNVAAYTKGRLLYLVGRALESLCLYDQAAIIYYRALRLPLTNEEKIDLYYRRARVYLAKKDLASAERLLKYLREIYNGKKPEGEIYYLSGRLREAQSKYEEALVFYSKAVEVLTFPDKKSTYNDARLRMLFNLEKYDEASAALIEAVKEERLTAEELQGWYAKLGDILFKHDNLKQAADAYLAGLDEKMPRDGEPAQRIHLHLGDVYIKMGDTDKSISYFEKAKEGADSMMRKIAEERLNQIYIDRSLSALN